MLRVAGGEAALATGRSTMTMEGWDRTLELNSAASAHLPGCRA
jgi:hypothetical protein